MSENEIMEMIIILTKMSTDTYEKCKYVVLASAHSNALLFFKNLFATVEKRRPKQIGMKEGAAV